MTKPAKKAAPAKAQPTKGKKSAEAGFGTPPSPKLEFAFTVRIRFERAHWVRPSNTGMVRAAILLDDGEFEGPNIRGKVVPISGGDFPLVRADGVIDFDARYLLQTDDGATIYLQSRGFRWHDEETTARLNKLEEVDPSLYYFRVAPKFDAPSGKHDWLNRHIFVGFGERLPDGNRIHYFKVL
jgi:hypothetical protein